MIDSQNDADGVFDSAAKPVVTKRVRRQRPKSTSNYTILMCVMVIAFGVLFCCSLRLLKEQPDLSIIENSIDDLLNRLTAVEREVREWHGEVQTWTSQNEDLRIQLEEKAFDDQRLEEEHKSYIQQSIVSLTQLCFRKYPGGCNFMDGQ